IDHHSARAQKFITHRCLARVACHANSCNLIGGIVSAVLKTVRRAMLLPVLSLCLWSLPGRAAAYECKPDLLKDHLQGLSRPDPRGVPGPTNIGSLKFVLRDYAYCGQYMTDFKTVIDQAAAYIEAHKSVAKPAIVLDI